MSQFDFFLFFSSHLAKTESRMGQKQSTGRGGGVTYSRRQPAYVQQPAYGAMGPTMPTSSWYQPQAYSTSTKPMSKRQYKKAQKKGQLPLMQTVPEQAYSSYGAPVSSYGGAPISYGAPTGGGMFGGFAAPTATTTTTGLGGPSLGGAQSYGTPTSGLYGPSAAYAAPVATSSSAFQPSGLGTRAYGGSAYSSQGYGLGRSYGEQAYPSAATIQPTAAPVTMSYGPSYGTSSMAGGQTSGGGGFGAKMKGMMSGLTGRSGAQQAQPQVYTAPMSYGPSTFGSAPQPPLHSTSMYPAATGYGPSPMGASSGGYGPSTTYAPTSGAFQGGAPSQMRPATQREYDQRSRYYEEEEATGGGRSYAGHQAVQPQAQPVYQQQQQGPSQFPSAQLTSSGAGQMYPQRYSITVMQPSQEQFQQPLSQSLPSQQTPLQGQQGQMQLAQPASSSMQLQQQQPQMQPSSLGQASMMSQQMASEQPQTLGGQEDLRGWGDEQPQAIYVEERVTMVAQAQ